MKSRNYSSGFAERTRKNLDFIECFRAAGADVHEVTQIVNSLLGLVVIPYGRDDFAAAMADKKLAQMKSDGWPEWQIILDDWRDATTNLWHIVRHLRNAAAHGSVEFSGNERKPEDVTITFTDREDDFADPCWIAAIQGDRLREFCERLVALIQDPGPAISP